MTQPYTAMATALRAVADTQPHDSRVQRQRRAAAMIAADVLDQLTAGQACESAPAGFQERVEHWIAAGR